MSTTDDRADSERQRAIELVEEAIRKLGIDPAEARAPGGGAYALRRGSARIAVAIHGAVSAAEGVSEREGTLRVAAPVVKLPQEATRGALFEHLLELNARELIGASFGVLAGEVVVVSERSLRDLDASEVDAAIRAIGRLADKWDDELATRFGAPRL
ncbi:MAG: YbjN domain-containing protein [Myxococcota bacterium]|nr:YbjN domain-containing protein [Myxococcota bacterium]